MLTIAGTGSCKFRLTHALLEAPQAPQVMQTLASSFADPFPMHRKQLDATPAGHYKWTAQGIEGCSGQASLELVVN